MVLSSGDIKHLKKTQQTIEKALRLFWSVNFVKRTDHVFPEICLKISATGLFDYVWPFIEHQALRS